MGNLMNAELQECIDLVVGLAPQNTLSGGVDSDRALLENADRASLVVFTDGDLAPTAENGIIIQQADAATVGNLKALNVERFRWKNAAGTWNVRTLVTPTNAFDTDALPATVEGGAAEDMNIPAGGAIIVFDIDIGKLDGNVVNAAQVDSANLKFKWVQASLRTTGDVIIAGCFWQFMSKYPREAFASANV